MLLVVKPLPFFNAKFVAEKSKLTTKPAAAHMHTNATKRRIPIAADNQ